MTTITSTITSNANNYEQQHVFDVYDKIASRFDDTRAYQWTWITDFMNSLKTKSVVLDIGCGGGRNLEFYSDKHQMFGIDTSKSFIDICKSKNLEVLQANMCYIPHPSNSFDALIVIASFHHLDCVNHRLQAMYEMYRILKPGGRMIMSVWSKEQPAKTRRQFDKYGDTLVPWKERDGTVYQRYYYIFRKDELLELINIAEFKVIDWKWDCGNEILTLQK